MNNLLKIGSMAVVAMAMVACSSNDFFEENNEAIASQHRTDYAANFIKKYGAIAPNKSWDRATMQPTISFTPDGATRAVTRTASSYTQVKKTGFPIEKAILDWCFTNIPAGKNNSGKGNPFYMTVPQNSFTIVPVFQGNASYYWQLWMHVEGVEEDIQIWGKGEDLSYKTKNGETITIGTEREGVSKDAVEVTSSSITFSGLPQGATMYFYLKRWSSEDAYKKDKQKTQYVTVSSLSEKMLALKGCPAPGAVPEENLISIIGCEDATDNDFEDLVFMAYGIPPTMEPEDMYETTTKRYMIEDLGSTNDFDFNDVVVDVSQQTKTTFRYSLDASGKKHLASRSTPVVVRQWAVVRAAGGILEFTINIGSTSWTKGDYLKPVEQMRNTGTNGAINYNAVLAEFEITNKDWVPADNNISIYVDGRGNNVGIQLIPFPKEGDVPMILAVDKDEKWMKERQSVPDDWILDEETEGLIPAVTE